MKKRFLSLLLLAALLLSMTVTATAEEAEQEAKPICTVEDLLAMAEDPSGSYILMNDLDMTGIAWKALDFSGTFDGNGHAILNLTLAEPGEEMPRVYDGNWLPYDGTCFGFFGTLRDAQIRNLKLLNVRGTVSWDGPVFMGALAGYGENVHISGCTVTADLELRAHDRIFGLGGLIGYAKGVMENCDLDLTLVNVDTDPETLDEQFLGGVCAIGFMDIYDCKVNLRGFVSDHGYVHSGGVVGMYMEYPWTKGQVGNIKGLKLEGTITFFEHNKSRRAYCGGIEGEMLIGWYYTDNNEVNFTRDERFEYDVELRPEMCAAPEYTETVTAANCWEYGYTTYTCNSCGYSFRDHYTLLNHEVTDWSVTREPTEQEEGVSVGHCDCGLEFTRTEPKLAPEPTEVPETTEAPTEVPEEPEKAVISPVILAGVLLLGGIAAAVLLRKRK